MICPLCSSAETASFYYINTISTNVAAFLRCRACDLVFQNTSLRKPEDEAMEQYALPDGALVKEWYWHKVGQCRKRLQKILRHTQNIRSLFEIGAASGQMIFAAQELGIDAWGIEIAAESKKIHDAVGLKTILIGDFLKTEIQRKFDLVVSIHSLEHMADLDGAVEKMKHILEPGGRIYLEVPVYHTIDRYLDPKIRDNIFDFPFHFYVFSKKSVCYLLKKHNLRVVSCDYSAPVIYARLLKLLRSISGTRQTSAPKAVAQKIGNKGSIPHKSNLLENCFVALRRMLNGNGIILLIERMEHE